MDYKRYAIYFAPSTVSPLGKFGNAWLGWNPEKQTHVTRPTLVGLSKEEIQDATLSPSRYGFHGTLKPPFRLKIGKIRAELEVALEKMASSLKPLRCGPLELAKIGRFLAFRPTNCEMAFSALADTCVWKLDEFREPPSEEELNRRRQNGLSERQDELLEKWGYPYVMDEFRFHLTLTDKLDTQRQLEFFAALQDPVMEITATPFEINDICLFGDPGAGKPFHLLKRYSL